MQIMWFVCCISFAFVLNKFIIIVIVIVLHYVRLSSGVLCCVCLESFILIFSSLSGHYDDVVVVIRQSVSQSVRQTERQTDR